MLTGRHVPGNIFDAYVLPRGQTLKYYSASRLAIIDGQTYRVMRFHADGGEGMRLTKSSGESYDVFLPAGSGELTTCDCKGFVAHGHCKHADAEYVQLDLAETLLGEMDIAIPALVESDRIESRYSQDE